MPMPFSEQPADERSQPPSQRRLAEARRQGLVACSRDLTAAAAFAAAAVALVIHAPTMLALLRDFLVETLAAAAVVPAQLDAAQASASQVGAAQIGGARLSAALRVLLRALWPVALAAVLAALLAGLAQTGGRLALRRLLPRLAHLGPGAAGRESRRRPRSLGLLGKATVVLLAIGVLAWGALTVALGRLFSLPALPEQIADRLLGGVSIATRSLLLRMAIVFVCLGLLDLWLARRRLLLRLRMSRRELADETRQHEGDPTWRELRRRRWRESVGSAPSGRVDQGC
jgi:flagellar biosynthesis protein FlhB